MPGGDGLEIAVRAVLTQQISVAAGRTHAARLVAAAGEPLARPRGTITHLFPTAEAIAAAPDGAFAMPVRRRETLRSLAGVPLDELTACPGIGPWTQAYVNMRALRDRDAWLGGRPRRPQGARRPRPRGLAPLPRLRRRAPLEHAVGVCPEWGPRPRCGIPPQSAAARRSESARHVRGEREPGEHQQPAREVALGEVGGDQPEEPEERRARGEARVEDAEREQDERQDERERRQRDERARAAAARSAPWSQTDRVLAGRSASASRLAASPSAARRSVAPARAVATISARARGSARDEARGAA